MASGGLCITLIITVLQYFFQSTMANISYEKLLYFFKLGPWTEASKHLFGVLKLLYMVIWLYGGERRGLVVSTEDCHSKGQGIKSRSFSFFYSFKPREKKRKTTNCNCSKKCNHVTEKYSNIRPSEVDYI